ncbi:hypothetical protein MKW92_014354 [Papaver armeniacum]|nr:hypothetical protein MKW92_014354 [Papaver armeniacum]
MDKRRRGKTLSSSLDDKSVEDILVKLPVKSLVRFKSVSKTWKSFIEEDSSFIQSHLSRSEAQLVITTTCGGYSLKVFSPKDGFQGGEAIHQVTLPWPLGATVPRPIHGLFCFIDHTDNYATRIYNLATRQATPWAQTCVPAQRGAWVTQTPTYGFGFDPLTKTYKLVCVWEIARDSICSYEVDHICEVLTVGAGEGGNQWRKIDEVPPVQLYEPAGVYANGSIYWRNAGKSLSLDPDEELIVAFDVGAEKFRVIQIPDFIVGPREILEENRAGKFTITHIDGRMALFDRADACVVKLWISDDDTSSSNKEMTTNWTEEATILLPPSFEEEGYLYFNPVQGTDEIVIQSPISDDERSPLDFISLYIFNRTIKTLRMIDITGITPALEFPYFYDVHIVHESLLPIQQDAEKKKLDQPRPPPLVQRWKQTPHMLF